MANKTVITSIFKGLNRLPKSGEGEGRVFKNLSLELYPSASSVGIKDLGKIYIKTSEGDTVVPGEKLQAVGDVFQKDEKYYLTGVCDGTFYYRGESVEYYTKLDDSFKITPDDEVEIEKIGKVYIVLTKKRNGQSFLWSFKTEGTNNATNEQKEADNKLTSNTISKLIPKEPFQNMYLYKLSSSKETQTQFDSRVNCIENASKKSYYMLFIPNVHPESKVGRKFPKYKEAFDMFKKYIGMKNVSIILKNQDSVNLSTEHYCFDDNEKEHPVRFVIDAAALGRSNLGDIDIIDALYQTEALEYEIVSGYDTLQTKALMPKDITGRGFSVASYDENGVLTNASKQPYEEGSGIIGHFEIWNEEMKRYDPVWQREPIYRVADSDNNIIYPEAICDTENDYFDTSSGKSYTAIPIKYAGIQTDALKINHICAYKNRIFATLADGSELICSALGNYTEFSEFDGVSTDSGYFQTMSQGEYTAVCEYQGTLICFKKDRMCIYYGDTVDEMSLSREILGVGCIDAKSIKQVGGVLYFLAKDGFYSYTGATPNKISRALYRNYIGARSAVCGSLYIAEAVLENEENETLVYDGDIRAWTQADNMNIHNSKNSIIFTQNSDMKELSSQEDAQWCFETGNLFENTTDRKGINDIFIRIALKGKMKVTTYQDEKESKHLEIEDESYLPKVWRIPVRLHHKNYYRIKIEGRGRCVLYDIERHSYVGGKTP